MTGRSALPMIVSVALVAFSSTALAGLTPDAADKIVRDYRAKDNSFCTYPPLPAFCHVVDQVPDCEGMKQACNKDEPEVQKPPDWLFAVARVFQYVFLAVVIAAILAALVWVIVLATRAYRSSRSRGRLPATIASIEDIAPTSTPIEHLEPDSLLARARALQAAGNFNGAIAAYLQACLEALHRKGAIEIARHRTNGEYVRALSGDTRMQLREVVNEADRTRFGKENADESRASRVGDVAYMLLRAVTLVVIAISFLGCGSSPRSLFSTKPYGHEVVTDLLQKQSAYLETGSFYLDSLPSEWASADGPMILVDTGGSSMEFAPGVDPEVLERALAWVADGGSIAFFGASPLPHDCEARSLGPNSVVWIGNFEDLEDDSKPTFERATLDYGVGIRCKKNDSIEALGVFADANKHDESSPRYALVDHVGRGQVLYVATPDLLENIGLSVPGNAKALVTLLALTGRSQFVVAGPRAGMKGVTSPQDALISAGLGLALLQAVIGALLLFLAYGARVQRPLPAPPPTRRSFQEHILATANLYSRAGRLGDALTGFAAFATERMRRSKVDPVTTVARKANMSPQDVQKTWERAQFPKRGEEAKVFQLILKFLNITIKPNQRTFRR